MIEMVLAHVDMGRVRFAYSPLRELVVSVRTLQDPGGQRMYRTWFMDVRSRLGGLNMELLTALAPAGLAIPSFVIPPPAEPWVDLSGELHAVTSNPPAYVRSELDSVYADVPLPSVLRPLYDDPASHLDAVAEELERYWHAAIAPAWPRLQALSMADVSHRMEQFAAGGVGRVLNELHPEIALHDNRLQIDKPHQCSHQFDLSGAGILLLPCVFAWQATFVECCGVEQPSLTYPPRGTVRFSDPDSTLHPAGLDALMGRTRAALLTLLAVPRTTTQLADGLSLSPGTVSEHLTILKASALVSARRHGRMVLYQRTAVGTALLDAVSTSGPKD
jgi:DNA-binding transcriptional ArsR family regulator